MYTYTEKILLSGMLVKLQIALLMLAARVMTHVIFSVYIVSRIVHLDLRVPTFTICMDKSLFYLADYWIEDQCLSSLMTSLKS